MTTPNLTSWPGPQPPSEPELEALLRREGLSPSWWSNAPGDRYGAHSHPSHKVLFCARGSIRFVLDGGRAHTALISPFDFAPPPHIMIA